MAIRLATEKTHVMNVLQRHERQFEDTHNASMNLLGLIPHASLKCLTVKSLYAQCVGDVMRSIVGCGPAALGVE